MQSLKNSFIVQQKCPELQEPTIPMTLQIVKLCLQNKRIIIFQCAKQTSTEFQDKWNINEKC